MFQAKIDLKKYDLYFDIIKGTISVIFCNNIIKFIALCY